MKKKLINFIDKHDTKIIKLLYCGEVICAAICVWCLMARGM